MYQLVRIAVHLIEVLFFTGLLGSLSVVLLSIAGDIRDFLQKGRTA